MLFLTVIVIINVSYLPMVTTLTEQKLVINQNYFFDGNSSVTHCSADETFPNIIQSINIFPEAYNHNECHCIVFNAQTHANKAWKYTYFQHRKPWEPEEFIEEEPFVFQGCGEIYFSVKNRMFTIKYASVLQQNKDELNQLNIDLPVRIITDQSLPNMLRCRNRPYDTSNAFAKCELESTTVSHSNNISSVIIMQEKNRLTKIILPAVLIPIILVIILLSVLLTIAFLRKRQKNQDNSAVRSTDSFLVCKAKSKDTRLKIHNYENVRKPALIEVVENEQIENYKSNLTYENVSPTNSGSTTHQVTEVVLGVQSSLYAQVQHVIQSKNSINVHI